MNYKRTYPVLEREFKGIAEKVTTEDVMSAAIELGCHYVTVHRYLRGEVAKKKFGQSLLFMLKEKIQERENVEQ